MENCMPFPLHMGLNTQIGKTNFHKQQHFDVVDELCVEKPLAKQRSYLCLANKLLGEKYYDPSWAYFDKLCLCFYAYYFEEVTDRPEETDILHKCNIYYYLEDDTMKIVEPRVTNSGLNQGTILKRHRFLKSSQDGKQYYTLEDINVGDTLNIYGRLYKITDCDPSTRNFLTRLGITVRKPEPVPGDGYMTYRNARVLPQSTLRPYKHIDKLGKFLAHDRHVLRFYCYWDDRDSLFGDLHWMVLHFFLADDTLEIRETALPNSGSDAPSCFLHRSKLPKRVEPLPMPGEIADVTILNVFGSFRQGKNTRYNLDNRMTGHKELEYYKDSDLYVGAVINVWGRKFVIYDCDEATKEYYKEEYGKEFTPLPIPSTSCENIGVDSSSPKRPIPYQEFSSDISPTHVQQNKVLNDLSETERRHAESHPLRFRAQMISDDPTDSERTFLISYFLIDNSIEVYEVLRTKTGYVRKKFLSRRRHKSEVICQHADLQYSAPADMYVGNTLQVETYKFLLMDADEYAFSFMENHPEMFPKSNINLIMEKLHDAIGTDPTKTTGAFEEYDQEKTGCVAYHHFRAILDDLTDDKLTEQEIITLGRHFREHGEDASMAQLVCNVQSILHKSEFDDFDTLRTAMCDQDALKIGDLPATTVYGVCRSLHVPLPRDLLKSLVNTITDDDGKVCYSDFLDLLDWRRPSYSASESSIDTTDIGPSKGNAVETVPLVKYQEFLSCISQPLDVP